MFDVIGLIAGPIVGFLGGLVNQIAAYKNKKLDMELEVVRAKNTIELENLRYLNAQRITELEQAGRERLTEMEGEISLRKADRDGLVAAMENDRATYLPPGVAFNNKVVIFMLATVDVVRGLIRPAITAFLVVILWRLNVTTLEALSTLSPEAIDRMLPNIADASTFGVIQLALTAVGYWFGSRSSVETFTNSKK